MGGAAVVVTAQGQTSFQSGPTIHVDSSCRHMWRILTNAGVTSSLQVIVSAPAGVVAGAAVVTGARIVDVTGADVVAGAAVVAAKLATTELGHMALVFAFTSRYSMLVGSNMRKYQAPATVVVGACVVT